MYIINLRGVCGLGIKGFRAKITLFFWDSVLKVTKRIQPSSTYYKIKYKQLLNNNELKKSNEMIIRGANYYHKDFLLNYNAAIYLISIKKYSDSLKYFKRLEVNDQLKDEMVILNYALVYKYLNKLEEVKRILNLGLELCPESSIIYTNLIEFKMEGEKWDKAITLIDEMKERELKIPNHLLIKRAMLYQIYGELDRAQELYNDLFENKKNEDNSYSKIILYDNGESRIELYKKHEKTNKVCITFDSINITWNQKPFGFDFLIKENIDILAIRRRHRNSYQQDLSLEDFYQHVNKPIDYYKRKIAYGFSLGAYSALYYGSVIDAEILSISPRNSTHPLFGVRQDSKESFQHNLRNKFNDKINPIIVYDPKNKVDNTYIERELKVNFPNGKYIGCPYAGHRVAQYFKQIGVLKDAIKSVIDNKNFPDMKKYNKANSEQYLRILGSVCLNRNKPNWALEMGLTALELAPRDLQVYRLIIKSYLKLNELEKATEYLNYALEIKENNAWMNAIKLLLDEYEQKQYNQSFLRRIKRTIEKM